MIQTLICSISSDITIMEKWNSSFDGFTFNKSCHFDLCFNADLCFIFMQNVCIYHVQPLYEACISDSVTSLTLSDDSGTVWVVISFQCWQHMYTCTSLKLPFQSYAVLQWKLSDIFPKGQMDEYPTYELIRRWNMLIVKMHNYY